MLTPTCTLHVYTCRSHIPRSASLGPMPLFTRGHASKPVSKPSVASKLGSRAYDNGQSLDQNIYLSEHTRVTRLKIPVNFHHATTTKWLVLVEDRDCRLVQKPEDVSSSSLEEYLPSKKRVLSVAVMEKCLNKFSNVRSKVI